MIRRLSSHAIPLLRYSRALPTITSKIRYSVQHTNEQTAPQTMEPSELREYNLIEYDPEKVLVSGYTEKSFIIGTLRLFGSVLLFPKNYFNWTIQTPQDITTESLKLVEYMNPTPEVLIIGTGANYYRLPEDIRKHLLENGIAVEEMRTVAAISTFNILNQEDRNVACALISIEPIDSRTLTPSENPALFQEIQEAVNTLSDRNYVRQVQRQSRQ
jgi:NADH dehydrogenase [ubiquinone] 1 alpha subcomplex assembly factor 3